MLNFFGEKELRSRKMYIFLLLLTVTAAFGLQLWRTLYNNYAVETVGLDGFRNGVIQSLREVPGFLAMLVVYLLLIFKEHRLAALSVFLLGIGVAMTGMIPTYYGLILATMLLSTGFHYFETLNQSLTLQYFDTRTAPLVFGRLRSLNAASNLLVGFLVLIGVGFLAYESMFIICGGLVVVMGLYCLSMNPIDKSMPIQKKGMVLKRKYWLYYTLTFLAGARRQVFVAFAVFLLVEKFNYTIQAVTLLFILNNAINYFLSPLIGKAIVRFGERKMLSLEY